MLLQRLVIWYQLSCKLVVSECIQEVAQVHVRKTAQVERFGKSDVHPQGSSAGLNSTLEISSLCLSRGNVLQDKLALLQSLGCMLAKLLGVARCLLEENESLLVPLSPVFLSCALFDFLNFLKSLVITHDS